MTEGDIIRVNNTVREVQVTNMFVPFLYVPDDSVLRFRWVKDTQEYFSGVRAVVNLVLDPGVMGAITETWSRSRGRMIESGEAMMIFHRIHDEALRSVCSAGLRSGDGPEPVSRRGATVVMAPHITPPIVMGGEPKVDWSWCEVSVVVAAGCHGRQEV